MHSLSHAELRKLGVMMENFTVRIFNRWPRRWQ
jgi:hypothetical protein